ncbi:MAG TPA: ABC transporter substrate-binding protein, partial [Pyrinomonadaceae bacterium]|nr:ABC transporter substrate-binding protein [Pyrinomonadaceae bacterium]
MLRNTRQLVGSCLCLALLGGALSCAARRGAYFGKIAPPADRALRYCTGPEIGSLDPQIGTSQSDYRIYMALFEGLTEYDPRTIEPIPGLAESWEVRGNSSEYIFHLRPNLRWSNGEPITAHDFVATIRRGLSPALASNNAYLGYGIKYAKAYNERAVFVRDPDSGRFLREKDFSANAPEADSPPAADDAPPENSFHHFLHEPARLTLPQDEAARAKKLAADERLRVAVAGKEFVPVRAEDIGVEAADGATLRIVLGGTTPYFLGLTSHPFFRAVPRQMIEGDAKKVQSAGPAFVSSGAFKLESWELYDRLVVVKNPLYWDAARVQLEKIIFYPLDELTTAMNLYK